MLRSRLSAILVLAVTAATTGGNPAAAQPVRLSPQILQQVEALRAEKAGRTPAQRKISSRLLYAAKMRRGVPIAAGIPTLRSSVEVDADGLTPVDLRAEVTPELLDEIEALGGVVVNSFAHFRAIRARVPLEEVETLARSREVDSIRPAGRAITRMADVSEGDSAHRADLVRSTFGVDGSGIKIGVLSDGVDSLNQLQGNGNLPPTVTVLPGQGGSGSEGTAMLEIVHDLAPGADLLFATAFSTEAQFANNILALRSAGADVIVDDVGYFAEPVFQDGIVAAAVNTVIDDGALYFSSAGNSGNLNDGSSGVWEGDYVFSGTNVNGEATADFGGGVYANTVTLDAPFVFTLHWSDETGASGNDYDLLLVDPGITQIFDASTDVQNGNDDPFEIINSGPFNDTGNKLVIVKKPSAAARFLHLNTIRGRLLLATDGQTSGHSAAAAAFSVAAVDVDDAQGPGGVFDGTESVEYYSSDGPRRIFYEEDGTPITPGDFSSSGGVVRQKPDLTAADCVSTDTPGFATFCGTSAAAPHAAAMAALLLERGAASAVTPEQIRELLIGGSLDIEAAGVDRDSGSGIVDAFDSADDCQDGIDNDGDGGTDNASDFGCDSATDVSERSVALVCDDASDNDGDGGVDFDPDPGEGDPGCKDALWSTENPQCQDGLNNDPAQDSLIDFDGGVAAGLPPAQITSPDPQCMGLAWLNKEKTGSCGLGFELVLLLPLLMWRSRRKRHGG